MKYTALLLFMLMSLGIHAQLQENTPLPMGILQLKKSLPSGTRLLLLDSSNTLQSIRVSEQIRKHGFQCLDLSQGQYRIAHQQKIYFIPQSDNRFKFLSLENYILSMAAVGFTPSTNPLRQEPDSRSRILKWEPDEIYIPRKIKGDWLQVEYGEMGSTKKAWIKWRAQGRSCIELFSLI
ncbi:MAG: hypothetical protein L6Q78_15900 [Bacteroidia bacterium]|nr:hypothetical protein [Bacteroidia bacterium]